MSDQIEIQKENKINPPHIPYSAGYRIDWFHLASQNRNIIEIIIKMKNCFLSKCLYIAKPISVMTDPKGTDKAQNAKNKLLE